MRPTLNLETWTLILPVRRDEVDVHEKIQMDGKEFIVKPEFHITMIGFPLGWTIKEAIDQDETVEKDLLALVAQPDFGIEVTGQKRYHIAKDKGEFGLAESIVEFVDATGVDQFLKTLGEIIDVKIEVPPAHLTTHTWGDSMGIGLPTQEEFESCLVKSLPPR